MTTLTPTLKTLQEDAYKIIKNKEKPKKIKSLAYFCQCIAYAFKLIFKEKEIFVFSLLQLVFLALGYYLFIQVTNWIPNEVWESARDTSKSSPADLVLTAWIFCCIGITTYPLGILTACIGAAHFLHANGEESTIAKCLKIVMPRAWAIWIFSWIDGWWTVLRILERIPQKKDRTPLYIKLRDELLFQAWKIASLGFLPALIIGRDLKNCSKDSLALVKSQFIPLFQLRTAYSLICWLLTIGSIISWIIIGRFYLRDYFQQDSYYDFFLFIGLITMSCMFFIHMFFRPIYIISACKMYSEYVKENKIKISLPTVSKFHSSIVAFVLFALAFWVVILYREELRIVELLSIPYR